MLWEGGRGGGEVSEVCLYCGIRECGPNWMELQRRRRHAASLRECSLIAEKKLPPNLAGNYRSRGGETVLQAIPPPQIDAFEGGETALTHGACCDRFVALSFTPDHYKVAHPPPLHPTPSKKKKNQQPPPHSSSQQWYLCHRKTDTRTEVLIDLCSSNPEATLVVFAYKYPCRGQRGGLIPMSDSSQPTRNSKFTLLRHSRLPSPLLI